MKKIVAAFDGLRYSESTTKYGLEIARKSGSMLAGVFLEDFTYHSYKLFDMVGSQGVAPEKVKQLMQNDAQVRKQAARRFEELCTESNVRHVVHHNRGVAIQELLRESIYCDLLVISYSETLSHYPEEPPSTFITDLLVDVQSPVLLVPPVYQEAEKVVLLYDGDPSSVYAAKMFSYMLPVYKELPTEVVTVNVKEQESNLPDSSLIREFINCHYPAAKFVVLEGDPETKIVNHLKGRDHEIAVLGAYRRSAVSRWFKESMANTLIKSTKLPLFIAHYK